MENVKPFPPMPLIGAGMAERMERIIEGVLRRYFDNLGEASWDEDLLEAKAVWEIDETHGFETLIVDGTPLAKFHPVRTHVEIDGERVTVRLARAHEVLI